LATNLPSGPIRKVAGMAHHFGVSYLAALFRLKSLTIVNDAEFSELRSKENYGKKYLELLQVLVDLEGLDNRKPDREIVSQLVHLALEAYRREEISKGKLRDLSTLLNLSAIDLLALAEVV
jgi:Zn-dependent peptidase ImmA (M78 family)